MKWYVKLILPAVLLIVWEIAAHLVNNAFILPTVESVFVWFLAPLDNVYGMGSILQNTGISILRVGLGFLIACVIAVPLGVLIGSHPFLEHFSDGLIQILRPIPPLAWIPLALAWFGIGMTSIVFIIVIGCIFPILVSTIDGVKRVKKSWLETAKIYQANGRQVMTQVILPAAMPAIWNGLRLGFGIAWMSVVAAEMMPGSSVGLGHMIYESFSVYSQLSLSIAGMVCIGIIGIVMDVFFKLVQKKKFAWEVLDK